VAGSQLLVVVRAGGGLRQLGRQSRLGQRGHDHLVEVVVALVVDPPAQRGVERLEHLVAVIVGRGDAHPDRSPGPVHQILVALAQLATLVEHRQAHHPQVHIDVPYGRHLVHPA